jgi:hypothetical protein
MCRVGGQEKTRKKKNFGSFWLKEMYLYNNSCWARRKSLIIINRWGGKRTDNILEREANVETIRHRCNGKKGEIWHTNVEGGKTNIKQKLVFYIYIMISFHHRCVCVCVCVYKICLYTIRRGRKQLDPVQFFVMCQPVSANVRPTFDSWRKRKGKKNGVSFTFIWICTRDTNSIIFGR